MITGDSKETATSIAIELDIISSSDDQSKCVFTGSQFEQMTTPQRK
jgi:magnesium-transporting ATPase (P-type)